MTIARPKRTSATKAPAAGQIRGSKAKAKPAVAPAKAETKSEVVLKLLRRSQGAILAELVAATGWLPHTTRAALTGLRKKGHVLEKSRRDDVSCYRIVAARP
jgi:hypothetical protein